MAASYNDIAGWFDHGVEIGATHMIVLCDTFEMSDYPRYIMPGASPEAEVKSIKGDGNRVMEVYNLGMDKDEQIGRRRCFQL